MLRVWIAQYMEVMFIAVEKQSFFYFKDGQIAYTHFSLKPLFNQCANNCAACVWGWRWGQWVSVADGEQVSVPQTEVFNI